MSGVADLDLARAARLPWCACEPYPACDGPDMGWHVRTDDDDFDYIVIETGSEELAELIATNHNNGLPSAGAVPR